MVRGEYNFEKRCNSLPAGFTWTRSIALPLGPTPVSPGRAYTYRFLLPRFTVSGWLHLP